VGLSRGFKAFLVASALFLWFLVEWQRGPGVATGAVALVTASVLAVVIGILAIAYAGTLAHELGHAIAAVIVSRERPLIVIGAAPRRLRFSIGRIDVQLGRRRGQAHCICASEPLSRARKIVIYAAGPAASAIVAGFWAWVATRALDAGNQILAEMAYFGVLIAGLRGVACLFPYEFERPDDDGQPRTMFTDGAHIVAALRNRPLKAPPPPSDAPPFALGAGPRARAVAAAMVQAARAENADAVGTEHLLRALATADEQTQAILRARGWTAEMGAIEPADGEGTPELPPPTPALRRLLDRIPDTLSLSGHSEPEPEHLLLALFRSGDNTALATLRAAGVDFHGLRADLVAALT
jgi:hypothetical protein